LHDILARCARVAVVTGDTGTGKSILLNVLADRLRASGTVVGRVPYDRADNAAGFRGACADAYQLGALDVASREALEREFAAVAASAVAAGSRVVLLIDEAESLPTECHAELAWLLDAFDALTVVLAGDDDVRNLLDAAPEPLRSGATAVTCLEPWSDADVAAYVSHALSIAGCDLDTFTPDATREVWIRSGGTPRLVNAICRLSLRASGHPDVDVIRRCADAVTGPIERGFTAVSSPPRSDRVTRAARIAVVSFAAGVVIVGAVVVATSQSAQYRGRDPDPPIRSHPRTAAARATTVAVPVLGSPAPDQAAGPAAPDQAAGAAAPDQAAGAAASTPPISAVDPVRPPSTSTSQSPPPTRRTLTSHRARRPPATAERVTPHAPMPAQDSGAIIDWLLDEYTRTTARRSN
jgi:type II secretory pathway predicted ATPase ExeA